MPPEADRPTNGGRFLLVHLNSNGDCLFATTIARQIKEDFPGCHLTWAIGSACRQIIELNPHVDAVWEIPLARISPENVMHAWQIAAREVSRRCAAGEFDQVFLTQFSHGRLENFAGTTRLSIFSGYPNRITVPVSPVLRLSDSEVARVRAFAKNHALAAHRPVILFEHSHSSAQSYLTPAMTAEICERILGEFPEALIILSSKEPLATEHSRTISAAQLSFRENAELTKYCDLLIGCSSGLTWLATSDWAKQLPTIQMVNWRSFASVVLDHELLGLSTAHIIERERASATDIANCVRMIQEKGFAAARKVFHQRSPIMFGTFAGALRALLRQRRYRAAFRFALRFFIRLPKLAWRRITRSFSACEHPRE